MGSASHNWAGAFVGVMMGLAGMFLFLLLPDPARLLGLLLGSFGIAFAAVIVAFQMVATGHRDAQQASGPHRAA